MSGANESRFFTTGELARHFAVSNDTVVKWIKRGELRSFATPGGHYRISAEAIRRFADRRGLRLDDRLPGRRHPRPTVLVVDDDPAILGPLDRVLRSIDPPPRVERAGNGYDAGVKAGSLRPDLVILGPRVLATGGVALCRSIRRELATRHTRILALVRRSTPIAPAELNASGADAVVERPEDPVETARAVGALLGVAAAPPTSRRARRGESDTAKGAGRPPGGDRGARPESS